MSDARSLLEAGVARLRAAGIEGAPRDARRLMAHALGVDAARLLLAMTDPVNDAQRQRFCAAIAARARQQPVAQITGQRLFWGRGFRVTSDVLDPRPETEILIAAALGQSFSRVLDLGTGSGAILLSLLAERPQAQGVGTDLSRTALDVAQGNARALGLADRAEWIVADWLDGISGRFDLIVSNPPYLSAQEHAELAEDVRLWEPRMALVPHDDDGRGLVAYRQISARARAHLVTGGWLMVEIGPSQGADVRELLAKAGFMELQILRDLDGRDRVVMGRNQAALAYE